MSKGTNLLLKLGVQYTEHKVDIYKDGDVITLIAKGNAGRENEGGKVKTTGFIVQQYENSAAFEVDRKKLFERFPLAYVKICNKLGINDNINIAKPLPEDLRHLLPEYSKALPQNTEESEKSKVKISVSAEASETDENNNDNNHNNNLDHNLNSNIDPKKPWYLDLIEDS